MTSRIDNRRAPAQLTLGLEVLLDARSSVWRPIHYLGSKLRLTEAIRDLLTEVDPACGPVCDLFAGSGTVSLGLSNCRNVVASDIQEYSRVLCTALLQPVSLDDECVESLLHQAEHGQLRKEVEGCLEPLLDFEEHAIQVALSKPRLLCDLVEHGSLLTGTEARDSLALARREAISRIESKLGADRSALMATRYFGGVYFSYKQTLYIDCLLNAIAELPVAWKDTCLAALLSTASSIVNTVGKQFAQPMRPRRSDGTIKTYLIPQMCRDRLQDPGEVFARWLSRYRDLSQGRPHRVIRDDYRNVLSQLSDDVSVIYADPPYTRDHYSRFYHVLETLSLGDCPDMSTTLLTGQGSTSRGMYRTDRHQSPFCIKTQAPGAFSELFAGSQRLGVPLLLSYSPYIRKGRPRLMTVDAVANLATDYFGHVRVIPAGPMSHSKLNKTEHNAEMSYQAEVFIVGQP